MSLPVTRPRRTKPHKILIKLMFIIIFIYICQMTYLRSNPTSESQYYQIERINSNLTHTEPIDLLITSSLMTIKNNIPVLNIKEILKSELVFIGGYARSGTTLMRAILDVHPAVSCGPETKIIPVLLEFITGYLNRQLVLKDLSNARIDKNSIDSATSLFIYYLLQNHIENAQRLCAKDPNILYYIEYLHKLFPKAKFVYMVRDVRAVVYSVMTKHKEPFTTAKKNAYLTTWNSYNSRVGTQCKRIGSRYCKIVKYEDLVLKTEQTMRDVAKFLNIEYTDEFLRHDKHIGTDVVVSETEWSTDQIKKPVYNESLASWNNSIKFDNDSIKKIAFMFEQLGYQL